MVAPVKHLLRQTEAVISMRATFDPKTDERQFSVGASDFTATVLLHDVVRKIAREAPRVSVELVDVNGLGASAADLFKRNEIDMYIVPDVYSLRDYPNAVVFEERFVCVMWAGAEAFGKTLTLKDYASQRHVVRSNASHLPMFEEIYLSNAGIHRDVAVRVPTFIGMLETLVGTDLIATVPGRLARNSARYLPLRIFEAPIDLPPAVEVLHWHSHMDQDEGSKWFRNLILATAATLTDLPTVPAPQHAASTRELEVSAPRRQRTI